MPSPPRVQPLGQGTQKVFAAGAPSTRPQTPGHTHRGNTPAITRHEARSPAAWGASGTTLATELASLPPASPHGDPATRPSQTLGQAGSKRSEPITSTVPAPAPSARDLVPLTVLPPDLRVDPTRDDLPIHLVPPLQPRSVRLGLGLEHEWQISPERAQMLMFELGRDEAVPASGQIVSLARAQFPGMRRLPAGWDGLAAGEAPEPPSHQLTGHPPLDQVHTLHLANRGGALVLASRGVPVTAWADTFGEVWESFSRRALWERWRSDREAVADLIGHGFDVRLDALEHMAHAMCSRVPAVDGLWCARSPEHLAQLALTIGAAMGWRLQPQLAALGDAGARREALVERVAQRRTSTTDLGDLADAGDEVVDAAAGQEDELALAALEAWSGTSILDQRAVREREGRPMDDDACMRALARGDDGEHALPRAPAHAAHAQNRSSTPWSPQSPGAAAALKWGSGRSLGASSAPQLTHQERIALATGVHAEEDWGEGASLDSLSKSGARRDTPRG